MTLSIRLVVTFSGNTHFTGSGTVISKLLQTYFLSSLHVHVVVHVFSLKHFKIFASFFQMLMFSFVSFTWKDERFSPRSRKPSLKLLEAEENNKVLEEVLEDRSKVL